MTKSDSKQIKKGAAKPSGQGSEKTTIPVLRRDTPQDDQERKSRAQFCEVFSDWIPADITPDKGEDLLVRIYEDRRSTALTFYAQLKSTQNLDAETQTSDSISLSLETKDLPHWQDSNPPVVVVFWDVNARRGVWQDFPTLFEEVNRETPNWQRQKTVTIHLPKANTTDDVGRRLLRHRIAMINYPTLSEGKTLEIKFKTEFPATDEGQKMHASLIQAIEDGLPIAIPPENITSIKMSEWHERAFGPVEVGARLEIIPRPQEQRELILIIIGKSVEKLVSCRVALRHTGGGLVRSFWDNSHRDDPFLIKLTVADRRKGKKIANAKNVQLSAEIKALFPRKSVEPNLDFVRLMICAAQGGTVEIRMDGMSHPFATLDIKTAFPLERLKVWESFLKKLKSVQEVVKIYGSFDLSSGFTRGDMITTEWMHKILVSNEWDRIHSFRIKLTSPFHPNDETIKGPLTARRNRMGRFDLLGVRVPIGPFEAELLDTNTWLKVANDAIGKRQLSLPDCRWRYRLLYDPTTPPPDLSVDEKLQSLTYSSSEDDDEDSDHTADDN